MIGYLLLTYRELRNRHIVVGLFLVCTLVWMLLAFALGLDVVDGTLAGFRVFGLEERPDGPRGATLTLERFIVDFQVFLSAAAYWTALLLGLFASGPLPASLTERGRVDLLLSKPVSRSAILGGHLLGVALVVAAMATYLLVMCWLALSLKSGIWNPSFLLVIPLVIVVFMVMYGVLCLVVITTESTSLSLIVTYGLIFASIILSFKDQLAPQINLPWRYVYLGLYHVLPHVTELTGATEQLVRGTPVKEVYPLAATITFGVFVFGLTFARFSRRDY